MATSSFGGKLSAKMDLSIPSTSSGGRAVSGVEAAESSLGSGEPQVIEPEAPSNSKKPRQSSVKVHFNLDIQTNMYCCKQPNCK